MSEASANKVIPKDIIVADFVHDLSWDDASPRHRLWHLGSPQSWALLDSVVAFCCMLVAFRVTPSSSILLADDSHAKALPTAAIFCCCALIASYISGFGHVPNLGSRLRIILLAVVFTGLAISSTTLVIWFVYYKQIGRYIVIIAGMLFFIITATVRLLRYKQSMARKHRIVLYLYDDQAACLSHLIEQSSFPIEILSPAKLHDSHITERVPVIHEIVVCSHDMDSNASLLSALDCGIAVSTAAGFAERHFFRIPVVLLDHTWFFQVDLKQHHPFYFPVKRMMDIIIASVLALFTLPLVSLTVLAIAIESKGAPFYSQERVGFRQKPFTIWKLRSMRIDAEPTGPQWAAKKDSRVTKVGKVIRATRIDELPQLWNILRGDMTFVGPRPERPEFVEKLACAIPFYRQRHLVKPGLTGWAQICYPYGAGIDDAREKLSYDLYYLKNASFVLDMQIILQTVGAVAKGAR